MTKEQFCDLVAEMRAQQKFAYLWPDKYKASCILAEQKVDEAIKNIHVGKW